MTDTLDHPIDRVSIKDKLFVTDEELMRVLGVPPKVARPVLEELENKAGFPQKQKMWGYRRYLPAVRKWLDRTNGLSVEGRPNQGGRP